MLDEHLWVGSGWNAMVFSDATVRFVCDKQGFMKMHEGYFDGLFVSKEKTFLVSNGCTVMLKARKAYWLADDGIDAHFEEIKDA